MYKGIFSALITTAPWNIGRKPGADQPVAAGVAGWTPSSRSNRADQTIEARFANCARFFDASVEIISGIERLSPVGQQVRKATFALYFSALFRSLPRHQRHRAEVQRRVYEEMETFESGVFELGRLMSNSGLLTHPQVIAGIAGNRAVTSSFLEQLARRAIQLEYPLPLRLHLRALGREIDSEMRRRSPVEIFEGYWFRVRQIRELVEHGATFEELEAHTTMGRKRPVNTPDRKINDSSIQRYWRSEVLRARDDESSGPDQHSIGTVEPAAVANSAAGGWSLGIGTLAVSATIVERCGRRNFKPPGAGLILTSLIILAIARSTDILSADLIRKPFDLA